MSSIKKALKEKRLKKLKQLKMLSKPDQREEQGEQEDEEETGEQLMQLAAESKTKIGKAKVLIKEDGEDSAEEGAPQMDEEPLSEQVPVQKNSKKASKKNKKAETSDQDDQPLITEEQPEEQHFEEVTHTVIKRPYNSFTLSIGFPDSVIQKCQVVCFKPSILLNYCPKVIFQVLLLVGFTVVTLVAGLQQLDLLDCGPVLLF